MKKSILALIIVITIIMGLIVYFGKGKTYNSDGILVVDENKVNVSKIDRLIDGTWQA